MGATTLASIVRALGGDLWAGGARANVPGPGHGPHDRSVSLLLSGDRVVVHCFAGDDWRHILQDLIARGLVDATGRLIGGGAAPASPRPGPHARAAIARRLWSEAEPLAGSLSARHLVRRRVRPPPEGLRHHPRVAAAVYDGAGPVRPALLAAIRPAKNGADDVVGVEVTYLDARGDRARVALPRKTVGLCPAGAAVRLGPVGPRLLVGEGVFSCLSASRRFGLPAWALLSTRNLRTWRAPPGVRFVLIAADCGADGEASARVLADALGRQGVAAEIRWPPPPFGDWNEASGLSPASAKEAEEGTGSMGAADGWSGPSARRSCHDP